MAKYRVLTLDELKELEKEFVDYLILNGITADEWEKLKEEDNVKAEKIVELFSDVVFEKILRQAGFLLYKGKNEIYAYQCLPDKMVLVGLEAPHLDLSDHKNFKNTSGVKVFTTEKGYKTQREEEMFEMIQKGCEISDGEWFKKLCLAL